MESNLDDVLVADKTRPEPKPKTVTAADLSAEIAQFVAREKGERVKVRRVYGDHYRCNWLAPDYRAGNRGGSLALETFRIRDSKFLRARKTDAGLEIEDVTAKVATTN
jgi:hypothetical protein